MAKTYGYCRISTPQQNIERQVRNILAEYPRAIIRQEAYTGTTMHRPEWAKLMKTVKSGDTIVFDSVSRMSRDSESGCQIYMELYSKGVDLVFLKEHHIDTATYKQSIKEAVPMTGTAVDCILEGINKYLMVLAQQQIRIAFDQAEKEVQDLRQRTKEGMETARQNGKQIGQATGARLTVQIAEDSKATIAKHSKAFGGSLSDADCQKLCGCSRNSFYSYKRRLKQLYDNFWNEDNDPESESWREDLTPAEQAIVEDWDSSCSL